MAALLKTVDERDRQLEARDAEIVRLKVRVDDLETQLGQSSSNSHKPLSSDVPGTRPPKPGTGRKPGGQPGHKPNRREMLPAEKVTRRTVVKPTACKCCGSSRLRESGADPRVHQVLEVPEIAPDVHEIRSQRQVPRLRGYDLGRACRGRSHPHVRPAASGNRTRDQMRTDGEM